MKISKVHIVAKDDGEAFHVGPIHIRVMEDGSRTNRRFGAVEITVCPIVIAGLDPAIHAEVLDGMADGAALIRPTGRKDYQRRP